jgi:hypothetical protein
MQPFRAAESFHAKAQIAAASGHVEGNFWLIAGIRPKRGVGTVQRAIKKLRTVRDDEIAFHRMIAQRALNIGFEKRAGLIAILLGRFDEGLRGGSGDDAEQGKEMGDELHFKARDD